MSAIVATQSAELVALALAQGFAEQSMAPNTVRAYRASWADFAAWCDRIGVAALPADPAHVAAYIASLATTRSPATIAMRLSAIAQMHRLSGQPYDTASPALRQTQRGLLRLHGRPPKQAKAVRLDAMRALVDTCDNAPAGVRDRALLLLGFAGAMRRSEIVALMVSDVAITGAGARIWIRRSKTDQEQRGALLDIPRGAHPETCPVAALEAWLALLGEGEHAFPLFRRLSRSGQLIGEGHLQPETVRVVLDRRAKMAGLAGYSPHGLRAGFVTEAASAGVPDDQIMTHTRHRSWQVMRTYVRRATGMANSPAGRVGL